MSFLYILVSSEVITMLQKTLFSHTFYEIHVCFLLHKNEGNLDNKYNRNV